MELAEVRRLGQRLMAEHGLVDWSLDFDDAKVRAGQCRFAARSISLSRPLMRLYDEAHVRETLLHEIAHALVGPAHGHDAHWRATALRLGSTGRRCVAEDAPRTAAPWRGTCPNGHVATRHRQPSQPLSCTRCTRTFSPAHLFTWRFEGREVPMSAAYQSALDALTRLDAIRARAAEAAAARSAASSEPPPSGPPPMETPALWSDDEWDEQPLAPAPLPLAAVGALPVGAPVLLAVRGKYAGLPGVVEKRGRTRYHVRTAAGLLSVPFPAVVPTRA
jgi:predicted SprT family Zn-dependent metalloprotease